MKGNLYLNFYFFLILQWSSTSLVFGQNLVQNGGFETNTAFPTVVGQYALATGWSNANSTASPDYLHLNGIGMVQLPNSIFGTVNPYQGSAIMGFVIWYSVASNYREYISQTLDTPLTVGKSYTFSFYLSNGTPVNYGGAGVKNVQVDFAVNPITQIGSSPLNYTPLLSTTNFIYSNSWIPISFTFTATAPYTNFVIGNFANDANTLHQTFDITQSPGAYYFIDEVSLVETVPAVLTIAGDSVICAGDTSWLTSNFLTGVTWADSLHPSIILSTTPSCAVYPTVNSTYFAYTASDTASFKVLVNNASVNLGADVVLCKGDSVKLSAETSNASYVWQDSSSLSYLYVSEAGNYSVTIEVNTCKARDTLHVALEDCEIYLEMPNVFSPNNDGINDFFYPIRMNGIEKADLLIFNRWGQRIAEIVDLTKGWDGKYNSIKAADGTYFWLLNYTTKIGENKSLTGTLLLEY